jgi:hypothetical protein
VVQGNVIFILIRNEGRPFKELRCDTVATGYADHSLTDLELFPAFIAMHGHLPDPRI